MLSFMGPGHLGKLDKLGKLAILPVRKEFLKLLNNYFGTNMQAIRSRNMEMGQVRIGLCSKIPLPILFTYAINNKTWNA